MTHRRQPLQDARDVRRFHEAASCGNAKDPVLDGDDLDLSCRERERYLFGHDREDKQFFVQDSIMFHIL